MRNEDRKRLVLDAESAFWEVIAKGIPNATSGDFPPDATFAFREACERAVEVWCAFNVPPAIGDVEIRSEGEDWYACTWAEFVESNQDGMDLEFDDIRAAVIAGRTYVGGGGAQPRFAIRAATKGNAP